MKRILSFVFAMALLIAAGNAAAELEVEFLDVGKADAILIHSEDAAILIDAATEKEAETVLQALDEAGISELDLLIITHFDKDHVGGADHVVEAVETHQVLMPAYDSDSKQYRQFLSALERTETPFAYLEANTRIDFGEIILEIDVANEADYGEGEENDFSLVTLLRYGRQRFLFAGDAENPRLKELLEEGVESCQVLKVPHHGRAEKRSGDFFEAVMPEAAVITSAADELEDAKVVRLLEALGAGVYLTREGTVIMRTDGTGLQIEQIAF